MSAPAPIHLVIPTHTTRHLDICLLGAARQTLPPATITVACDVIDTRIDRLLQQCAGRFRLTLRHVRRVHHGRARISQVRNNAVRSLIRQGRTDGRILIVDGDTFMPPQTVEKHAALGGEHGLVVASRIMLTEARTAELDFERLADGRQTLEPLDSELAALDEEHKRALRHQRLRRFGLTKGHKPKILGGHFSMRFDLYRRINGCDEEYEGYGMEDDDLGRRAYAARGDSVVAIRDIPVLHLHHPTRQQIRWRDNLGYSRFRRRDLPARCERGLENPVEQHPVLDDLVRPSPTPARARTIGP